MIGYFDTSAFVPLLVFEPSTQLCRRFWDDADTVVSSRLLYVEAAAALAQAVRIGWLTEEERRSAGTLLDELWDQVEVVEVDELLVREAAGLAQCYALRGYDAVHCASAQQLNDDDVVVAAGDRRLLMTWTALGMSTLDTNQDSTEGVAHSTTDDTAASDDEPGDPRLARGSSRPVPFAGDLSTE